MCLNILKSSESGDEMKILNCFIIFLFSVSVFFFTDKISVSAAEHSHVYTELYKVKPTCTEAGYTVYSCDCGETYEGKIENALGHYFSEEIVCFKKATCVSYGEGGRYCKRCYAKKDIVKYAKTAHKPVYVIKNATVKRNGKAVKECSECKKLYSSKDISKISSVKLEKKTYTYDGKAKTPSITVKDSAGNKLVRNTDYTLEYGKGRKKAGKYSVKVNFKGNYEGSKTLYFKIIPATVKNIDAVPAITSVTLSWDKAKGASGYEIYVKDKRLISVKDTEKLSCTVSKINGKKLKSGTDYAFVIKSYKKSGGEKVYSSEKKIKFSTKPSKARIKKVKSAAGTATVTVKKQNCYGYEFLLSTNKSFSNPKKTTVKGKSKTSYTFKNLIKGKKYYVKVRAYVASGGEKYRGYYSDVKTFKA